MNTITYQQLNRRNLFVYSLDQFERYQEVARCWRKIDNEWIIVKNEFVENWNLEKLRCVTSDLLHAIDQNCIAYGAFYKSTLIGFISLSDIFFGSQHQYIELTMLQISNPFRGKGIGRKLFEMASKDAKNIGAKKLYISAHSCEQSQAFYKAMGCVEATEINEDIARNEPFDCQMEYVL